MRSIQKLLSLGGEPLGGHAATIHLPDFGEYGSLGDELLALLQHKNGCYAFESALHIFPAAAYEKEMTLDHWNSSALWRHEYGNLADGILFFAEDALGDQFCLYKEQVCSFDAETAEMKPLGRTLEEWAHHLLEDYEFLTAYPLLNEWQMNHGALPIGMRLMRKIPFVLGGEFSLQNLYSINATSGMKTRGNLARQIKDLPDGIQVEFRVIE